MTFISIIFCVFGLYAFVRAISATSIILSVTDNRWGRPAVDKNLFEKIRVVDSVRITKWLFTSFPIDCYKICKHISSGND